jgi:predicted amidophosphoribosyltransferase
MENFSYKHTEYKDSLKNNCYCLYCKKFFTDTESFKMICPECMKEERQ